MHAKLCLKQDGKSTFNYENDIARMASVLKRGGNVFSKLAWKSVSVSFYRCYASYVIFIKQFYYPSCKFS